MADLVKFSTGTAAEFAALASKDSNTLYFITDERQLYKGNVPYGGSTWKAVSQLPASGETNVNYVVTDADGVNSLYFYNGTDFIPLLVGSKEVNSSGTNAKIPTVKAVFDFVKAEIAKVDAGGINDSLTDLEDRVKDLEDNKADATTTLAGYGITDAYTKTETDTAIATAVADAAHIKKAIVTTLPDVADALDDTIYMVAITDGSGNQKYEEFMLINGAFEKIGDTATNLTGYATENYVDTAVSASATATKNAYEAADQTILQSAADYADGLVEDMLTAADITEGTNNGTIAVGDGEVAVHGLGSAAYTETTAYDAAGAADDALSDAKDYTDSEIEKALTWQTL